MGDERCLKCGADSNPNERNCSTCGFDLGCPNVRAALAEREVNALMARYRCALKNAKKKGTEKLVGKLDELAGKTHVVVSVPLLVAREFFSDPKQLYANYESLVGSSVRSPAEVHDDCMRATISGKLFGVYGKEIRYGALSADGRGLTNYGTVQMKLRDVAIEERVSFLESNSYTFVSKHCSHPTEPIPAGYRAVWKNRKELVVAKLAELVSGHSKSSLSATILQVAPNRSGDNFVEAHIYGPFNSNAVESLIVSKPKSRQERIDVGCLSEKLKSINKICRIV